MFCLPVFQMRGDPDTWDLDDPHNPSVTTQKIVNLISHPLAHNAHNTRPHLIPTTSSTRGAHA